MKKKSGFFMLVAALVLAVVLGALAQQKADDKAVDPVCGMTVSKTTAKATYDYKGTTYYFCGSGCKDAFAKDPEKYLQAQKPKADDKAIDPVCGMTVSKATAKATYMYKGTTYYFCGSGCKDAFAKDPEKYLKKEAAMKEPQDVLKAVPHMMGQGPMAERMPMGHGGWPKMGGRMFGPMPMWHAGPMGMMAGPMGSSMNRLLLRRDVEWSYEKTAEGVTIKIASKDPETVKTIQERLAMIKEMKETMMAPVSAGPSASTCCCPNCPMKDKVKK